MKKRKLCNRLLAGIVILSMMLALVPPSLFGGTDRAKASEREHVVVVLDPGHGGYSSGAIGYGLMEKDCNLSIALACRDYLQNYENVDVYLTRSDDRYLELDERTDFAVEKNADLVVSLHNNAAGSAGPNGVCVYISRVQPFYNNTRGMAQSMCNNIAALGITNLGVMTRACTLPNCPDDDYYALIAGPAWYGIPGMIVEHAFISNPSDAARLANGDILRQMGVIDARAIAEYFNLKQKTDPVNGVPTLESTAYMQNYGWIATAPNGQIAGFDTYRDGDTAGSQENRHGRDVRMEAFKIDVNNNGVKGNIQYAAYVGGSTKTEIEKTKKGNKWLKYVKNGAVAGTTDEYRAVEAIKVRLTGKLAEQYDVWYRVKIGNTGWMGWTANDSPAGIPGGGQKIRAFQVKLQPKGSAAPGSTDNSYVETKAPDTARVQYKTHVQSFGWEAAAHYDGLTSGTTGLSKRLEAITVEKGPKLEKMRGDIEYRVHCQTYGWMDWVKNGETAGTIGEGKRLEAIQIRLTDKLAEKYDVYYRVHAQSFGWMNWAKNGEMSGTAGYGFRLEAIQIRLVKKTEAAPLNDTENTRAYSTPQIAYNTHVQRYGWLPVSYDGAPSGTTGQGLRMESICIANNTGISGSIRYRVHCQTYGWMDWKRNGKPAGTSGQGKRLEAIQIELTGKLAKQYDVYYRVHAQQFGWMGWAKNGEMAGTAGFSYRLESIQITLVEKGGKAPGSTERPFVQNQ